MNYIKKGLKWIGWVFLIFLLYIVGSILHATVTDYQPEEVISLDSEQNAALTQIEDSTISLMLWNVGYGALGSEADFFYDEGNTLWDNGMQVRPTEEVVEKNVEGAYNFLKSTNADFYLLQEVDLKSHRSYNHNQYEKYQTAVPDYNSTYAVNFNVSRIPLPVFKFWDVIGKVNSGLATYSKYQTSDETRYQLPGDYGWPTRVFQLDRCMSTHRVKVANGKELVVINAHLSAYDKGGVLKKQQMEYIKDFLMEEYNKGNYVVIGADWNQCPPNFVYDSFSPGNEDAYTQMNIPMDYLPEDWVWAYDATVPTNRKLNKPYNEHTSFKTLIDFYLISPNLKLKTVKGWDMSFEFSDHQPVYMEVELN